VSFDAFPFWVFLLAVWGGCLLVRHNAARKALLIAASYFLYTTFRPANVFLLLGVTAGSYAIGRAVQKGRRRALLAAGVCAAVAGLAATKHWLTPLPVGISFYMLQAIAWMVESYRGNIAAPGGLCNYTLYLSFFPKLTAGPIARAEDFLPQLAKRPPVDSAALWEALTRIVFGLFKKLAIADNLGVVVDPVFADLHASPGRILLATYAFAVQIYCDFSGYSDIALGTARLFGYRLPENFNWPYLARNPADFWRRWHISLSTWLRDYVYFSLPGLRAKSKVPSYVNLSITMVACGMWHGLGWTYALWGLYHGLLLVAHHARRRGETGSILLMQQLAVIGWILFRLNRISDLPLYLASLTHGPFFAGFSPEEWLAVALLATVVLAHLVEAQVPVMKSVLDCRWNPWLLTGLLALAMATAILSLPQQQVFLYFRF
jgi:D-alanyl-lipoteichoic acid acyltransferase DltB (MBOAT superfamily)